MRFFFTSFVFLGGLLGRKRRSAPNEGRRYSRHNVYRRHRKRYEEEDEPESPWESEIEMDREAELKRQVAEAPPAAAAPGGADVVQNSVGMLTGQ